MLLDHKLTEYPHIVIVRRATQEGDNFSIRGVIFQRCVAIIQDQ